MIHRDSVAAKSKKIMKSHTRKKNNEEKREKKHKEN
jgi:hypothetical protein